VTFIDEPQDLGYDLAIDFRMPGDFEVELYQPHLSKG